MLRADNNYSFAVQVDDTFNIDKFDLRTKNTLLEWTKKLSIILVIFELRQQFWQVLFVFDIQN